MKRVLKAILTAACLVTAPVAFSYDCNDWVQWDFMKRHDAAKKRVDYFIFNPSWYKNVPSPVSVKMSADDLCKISDMKSKDLDDILTKAAEMNGMTK